VVANLAVLKAGKIALRVDPAADRARTEHLLEDSKSALILTNCNNLPVAKERMRGRGSAINIDELDPDLAESNLDLSIPPNGPAYLNYTTGSTGKAKGVLNSHRSTLHAVSDFTNSFHVCAADRLALLGRYPIGKHLFNSLLNGATHCSVPVEEEGLLHLIDWLIEEEITVFISLPTAFRHLANNLSGRERFPRLRLIRLAGESLYRRDVELYRKYFPPSCLLVNLYSSAETGTICLYFIDHNLHSAENRIPVGYAVEGMKVSVLDEIGNHAGFNKPGEIVVQSRFLSSGYWQSSPGAGNSSLTANETQEKVYYTGDLGRMSEDGCLAHLGRKDSRVKIRSFRVDISEVEAVLAEQPEVKDVAVLANQTGSGDSRLIAYVVPRTQLAPTVTGMRNFLQSRLPDYMIPSAFVILDRLPLMATGKIDRRALPDPGRSRPALDSPYIAPRTPEEEQLAEIWTEVLSLEQVGVVDNFFDLGGHSLSATQVVSRVIKTFRLEIPLKALFESPTIEKMAAVIGAHRAQRLGAQDLHRLLAELESLSDEEAQKSFAGRDN
jgi:acyl-coenzyme A synthetase/AMP-(fatty) acid ligase/acyl carrier protein